MVGALSRYEGQCVHGDGHNGIAKDMQVVKVRCIACLELDGRLGTLTMRGRVINT